MYEGYNDTQSLLKYVANDHILLLHTVNGERFAGLNFHGFNPTEVFAEILSCFLRQKYLLLMSSTYIHGKTFAVFLITAKV